MMKRKKKMEACAQGSQAPSRICVRMKKGPSKKKVREEGSSGLLSESKTGKRASNFSLSVVIYSRADARQKKRVSE